MSRFNIRLSSTILLLLLASPLWAQDNLTARRPFGQHTTAFSATPVFDAGVTDNWKITLTGNVTGSTLVSPEAGHTYTWEICQDATGSRTFVWPSQLVGPISISATANACTTEIFYYDGTNGVIPTTTTGGGGGSGTVNSGTVNQIAKYTAATTVSSDGHLDDGLTTANTLTYDDTGGIAAKTFSSIGTGAMTFVGIEGTCSGAATGKDVLCFGDIISHSAQISNNGDSFRSFATHQSTSPTPHGIMLASTFPEIFAAPRGTQGQPFLEGSGAGDPGYGQLDLSLATNVINRLVKANQTAATAYNDQVNTFTAAGTLDLSASTVASSLRVANGAGITCIINGAFCYDTTSNNLHAGINSADSFIPVVTTLPANNDCLKAIVTSGNLKIGSAGVGPCGSGGSVRWDQILAASGAFSTDNGDNPFSIRHAPTTSGRINVRFTESSAGTAGGTPIGWQFDTLPSSTSNPVQICAQGTSNCWRWDAANLLKPIGTATLAVPGTAHGVVVSEGSSAATATPSTGVAGQVFISNGAGADPSFQDPIISQAYVNLWTAQDVTVTRTSAAVRNPVFSQTGTLQLTWASITGSPATCTLQIQGVDSQGNALNNGSTFSVSPANGTTSQAFLAASTLQSAAQVKAVFACVTYPSTGTLTLDYTPIPNVNVINALQAGTNIVGKVGIDQTAPGTTNAVFSTNWPTTVDTNSGNKSASTPRIVIATDQPSNTNPFNVQGTLSDNGAAASANNAGVAPAIAESNMPSAATAGRDVKLRADLRGNLFTTQVPSGLLTFTANKTGLASAASATDIAILPGNATNTVIVTRVQVTCTQTTAGIIDLQLIKRSTADSAGTSASMTVVPLDSGNSAGVSVPLAYTANPTTGTSVGNVDSVKLGCMAPATASASDIYIWKPGMGQAIVLRGTGEQLAVNLNGVTVSGSNFNITFSWIETTGL